MLKTRRGLLFVMLVMVSALTFAACGGGGDGGDGDGASDAPSAADQAVGQAAESLDDGGVSVSDATRESGSTRRSVSLSVNTRRRRRGRRQAAVVDRGG